MPEDQEPERLVVDIKVATEAEEEAFDELQRMNSRGSLLSANLPTTSFHDPLQSGHEKPGHTVRKG